ncbi:MAG: heavy metal-responsive transcriptional regulator [Catenulispora sp.]|nr:heavy metal-responsive transcriptional regulator [Catenulispora sp.]
MRIGELAEVVGTTTNTLRFYEEQGLLPEADRTPTGYRDYPAGAADRVGFIHRGKAAGLTLAQIRGILQIRDRGQAPCHHVRDLLDTRLADLDVQISQLCQLRTTIAELRARAAAPDPGSCGPDDVCRYL